MLALPCHRCFSHASNEPNRSGNLHCNLQMRGFPGLRINGMYQMLCIVYNGCSYRAQSTPDNIRFHIEIVSACGNDRKIRSYNMNAYQMLAVELLVCVCVLFLNLLIECKYRTFSILSNKCANVFIKSILSDNVILRLRNGYFRFIEEMNLHREETGEINKQFVEYTRLLQ